jgi:HlyD family secretion protein
MINNWHRWLTLIGALLVAGCTRHDPDADAYQGVVELEERDLGFEVAGRVRSLEVHEGDRLEAGTLIASIDPELEESALSVRTAETGAAEQQLALLRAGARPEEIRALRARVDAAVANETLLRTNAERSRRLFEGQAVPRAALDQAEAELARATADRRAAEEQLSVAMQGNRRQEVAAAADRVTAARANVDLQRRRVGRYELRALEPAEVLEIHVRAGEFAVVGQPVITVADTRRPYADVFVPQGQLDGIRVGATARARVDSLTQEIQGRVERVLRTTEFSPRYIFSRDERANLVVRVRLRFDDPQRRLHAGVPLFARIERGGTTAPVTP